MRIKNGSMASSTTIFSWKYHLFGWCWRGSRVDEEHQLCSAFRTKFTLRKTGKILLKKWYPCQRPWGLTCIVFICAQIPILTKSKVHRTTRSRSSYWYLKEVKLFFINLKSGSAICHVEDVCSVTELCWISAFWEKS